MFYLFDGVSKWMFFVLFSGKMYLCAAVAAK
mgnify:CR=1 FL=1